MKPFLLALVLTFVLTPVTAGGRKRLVVLHTNDMHSTVMPLNRLPGDTLRSGRGGMLRLAALVERERKQEPDLLLFDSGDFSQGSVYYTLFGGRVEIELMNRMHYDAATLGNHEFDRGVAELAARIRQARFPFVCANYDFGTTELAALVKPYVVIRRRGLRIGVFGLGPMLEGTTAGENIEGITFLDPAEAARRTARTLKEKERCQVVICLSHLGWDMAGEPDDRSVIPATEGIDLVLGGHTHSYFKALRWVDDAAGKPVPVDQNGKYGVYVGRMVLELEKSRGATSGPARP